MVAGDSELGIQFVHDDILPPGTTIGEHSHIGNEEIYFIVDGEGTLILDGVQHSVSSGDISLCRSGHSHGLINSGKTDMRLLVVCIEAAS